MEVSVKGGEITIDLKHIDCLHIYGYGMINPGFLLRWGELGRHLTILKILNTMKWNVGEKTGNTMFLRWQQFTCTDALLKMNKENVLQPMNEKMLKTSFRIINWIENIGSTSIMLHYKLINKNTGEILGYGANQAVCVDVAERRRKPFTEETIIKVRTLLKKQKNEYFPEMSGKSKYDVPKNLPLFHYNTKIGYSGCDANGHINHAVYVSLCVDAVNSAITQRFFSGLPNHIKYLQLKYYSFLYLKECNIGDNIDMIVWQNRLNPLLFHFHAKVDGVLVQQCEILFYVDQINSNL